MRSGSSPYFVELDQLTIDSTKVSVPIVNTQNNVRLRLEIWALKGNMARVKLDELEPSKERYEPPVGDVLVGEPALQR